MCGEFWRPAKGDVDGDGDGDGTEGLWNTQGVSEAGTGTGRGGEHAPADAKGPIFFYVRKQIGLYHINTVGTVVHA